MEIPDISEICPQDISRILEVIPDNASSLKIVRKYSKDLQEAICPVISHPRYHAMTFLDVVTS